MEIDGSALAGLASRPPFHTVHEANVCDHSVEIQLPLLLKAAPGVPLIPLYVGTMTADERRAAAGALAELAGPGDVFLASSDLTHYGLSFGYQPFPPDEDAPHRLKELDEGVIEAAGSVDASFFLDHLPPRAPPSADSSRSRCCSRPWPFRPTRFFRTPSTTRPPGRLPAITGTP